MPQLQSLDGTGYYLWFYLPQLWASISFTALFMLLTGLHIWRMVKTRTWFCLAFVIGGIFELLGYAMRAYAYNNTDKIMPYAFYAMATLLAPALFAASIYMTLGHLVRSIKAQSLLIIPERWVTGLFVGGDISSFIIQGGGCGLMVMRNIKYVEIGEKVVVAGLVIQIVMFGLFGLTSVLLHWRRRQHNHNKYDVWEAGFYMLYAVSALIMVRSIFRTIEFARGRDGYLLRTEWPALVFDASFMFLTVAVFFMWHPSRYISLTRHEAGAELTSVSGELSVNAKAAF